MHTRTSSQHRQSWWSLQALAAPHALSPHASTGACSPLDGRRATERKKFVEARGTGETLLRRDDQSERQQWRQQQQQASLPENEPTCIHVGSSSTQATIQVFGLCHLEAESEAAEWIWEHRPAAVVFETAVNGSHGADTGAAVSTASVQLAASDFRLRMFMQIAGQLSANVGQPSSSSHIWQVRPSSGWFACRWPGVNAPDQALITVALHSQSA